MSKWLAKHISTKVSLKITIRKRHVYIDIRWPWKWNHYFYLGIWEDEHSKIIFLPSFQLVTRLNSQNWNETSLLRNSNTNLYMNISISNWDNSSFDSKKMTFFTLFQFLTRLLTSNHINLISTLLVGQNGVMWKTCFSASQNAKNESQLKHKTNCVTDFYWQLGLRVWSIILEITWWAHKRQTFTLILIKFMWILKFFVYK